ncbi:MAG: SRPBCC domain-containing protein [Cytophaga sp.]|uniref:SRPBCC domain-containing protein n=1 Tax=Cytophaga sp. TaxID=29535 RepID=UPI003F7E3A98
MERKTKNVKRIPATKQEIYRALTDPKAIETWMVPSEMTGKVHHFDLRVGGGYEMSLFYPDAAEKPQGKTGPHEDRYTAKFVELKPFDRIVQTCIFHSPDPDFSGEMTMIIDLATVDNDTEVTIAFENIPAGISLKDNEDGTASSLEKLAAYVTK